jgi:hypothetical protein
MRNRKIAFLFMPAAAVALLTAVAPDTATAADRFTYTPANAAQSSSSDKGPWEIVVNRWSGEGERDLVVSAAGQNSPGLLQHAISRGQDLGSIKWPGLLHYTIRYAHRIPRPDGGEDIVLGTDQPIWMWWDKSHADDSDKHPYSVIQLRLNGAGSGEGKLSLASPIAGDTESNGIVLQDYASQPVALLDVRRATT